MTCTGLDRHVSGILVQRRSVKTCFPVRTCMPAGHAWTKDQNTHSCAINPMSMCEGVYSAMKGNAVFHAPVSWRTSPLSS